jgi:rubredoxin
MIYCPVCGGEGIPLGTLGKLRHYTCRNCGMQFSTKKKDPELSRAGV